MLHVSLCVHACACVRACMWVPGCVSVCMRIRAYSVPNPVRNAMRHIVTSFVAPRSPLYFSTLSHNGAIFGLKVIENKMCVFIFSTTFVSNISHSKKNLARHRQKCRNVFM